MKSTRNEILTHCKESSVYITFLCGRNEVKICFGDGPRKMIHSVKANHFCFDEITACADVSFCIISIRIVFIWHFITRNEILFLSKWPQWLCHWFYHVSSYKKLTRHQNDYISFRPKLNLKHAPSKVVLETFFKE